MSNAFFRSIKMPKTIFLLSTYIMYYLVTRSTVSESVLLFDLNPYSLSDRKLMEVRCSSSLVYKILSKLFDRTCSTEFGL